MFTLRVSHGPSQYNTTPLQTQGKPCGLSGHAVLTSQYTHRAHLLLLEHRLYLAQLGAQGDGLHLCASGPGGLVVAVGLNLQ